MSERKTAEIKFRVRPSDKARWQQEAALAEITLSELIENAVTAHVSQETQPEHAEECVSGGHELFETPVVPIQDDEHPGAAEHPWMFRG